MKLWKKSNKAFVKAKGWTMNKGWKIDPDQVSDMEEFSQIYFEELSDFVQRVEYWEHPTHSDHVYEDLDELIEMEYEDHFDEKGNLYDEITEGWR